MSKLTICSHEIWTVFCMPIISQSTDLKINTKKITMWSLISNFILNYTIMTAWYLYNNKHKDKWSRIGNSRREPDTYVQLILDKNSKPLLLKQLEIYIKKKILTSISNHIQKLLPTWSLIKVKIEIIKPLEVNIAILMTLG